MNFNLSCSCNENFHFMKITKMNSISIGPCLIYEIKVPFFFTVFIKDYAPEKKISLCYIKEGNVTCDELVSQHVFASYYWPLPTQFKLFLLNFQENPFFFFFSVYFRCGKNIYSFNE